MATVNNAINNASSILVVGPIGTAQQGTALITSQQNQAAITTGLVIGNATNNALSGCLIQIFQQMSGGNAIGGIGFYNDAYTTIPSVAGYFVVQNATTPLTQGKGVMILGPQATDNVIVALGTAGVTQAIWNTIGGQYRGYNSNTAPPAGYLGEQIIATATGVSIAASGGGPYAITNITLTPGNWDIYGKVVFRTTGTVTGNCDWECYISTTSGSSTAIDGLTYGFATGTMGGSGVMPISGLTAVCITAGPVRVSIASNTTYYINAVGSASIAFTNVTGSGGIRAVRVA
jgi:hypothetical protein